MDRTDTARIAWAGTPGRGGHRIRHHASALALGLAGMTLAYPAAAQADRTEPPRDGAEDKGEIVVTGARVRGSAIRDTQPVAVLGAEAIHALGATSMTELLKRLKPMTTSSSGADPVFLLNGRRISGFSEMQTIPPEAIERTEVLPEQEAPRFGFPPTVRIVNFITLKQFRSTALQQLAGTTTEGGGGTNYTELTSTRIDGARRTSLSVSNFRQNRVLQSQRSILPDPDTPFAVQGNVTGVDGGRIDPRLDALAGRQVARAAVPTDPATRRTLAGYADGTSAVTDIGPYRTLQPTSDTLRVDGTVAAPIGRHVSGSLNLTMEAQRSRGLNGLAPAVLRVPGGGATLPFTDDVLLYRYLPDAVLRQRTASLNLHTGATLQGDYRRWTWNLTTSFDRVRSSALVDRGMPLDDIQAAINAGADPMIAIPPALAGQRLRERSRTTTGTLVTKAVASGPVLRLPAGDASLTVTTDYARSASTGDRPGVAGPDLDLTRTTRGTSIAMDVPITSPSGDMLPFLGRLSANASVGLTGVSRYGRLVNATYGLNWSPTSPVQLSASVVETQTPPAIALLTSPLLTIPNAPLFDFLTGTSVPVTTLSGGNPDLAPERRRVVTASAAWTPIKDKEFRLALDYLDTRVSDQTTYFGSATGDIQQAFPGLFLRDATGRLVQADLRPVNVARESERKLRFTVNL